MQQLQALIHKAGNSAVYRWVLNRILWRTVPFNKPHRVKVLAIRDGDLSMEVPYIRANRNHIGGMHACVLATLCEYISGLSLLLHFSPKEYRIILKNIHMTYHYQAKTAVQANFSISRQEIERDILLPLKDVEAVFREFTVEVYDVQRNHICTGKIQWQIKAWKHVKMKV